MRLFSGCTGKEDVTTNPIGFHENAIRSNTSFTDRIEFKESKGISNRYPQKGQIRDSFDFNHLSRQEYYPRVAQEGTANDSEHSMERYKTKGRTGVAAGRINSMSSSHSNSVGQLPVSRFSNLASPPKDKIGDLNSLKVAPCNSVSNSQIKLFFSRNTFKPSSSQFEPQ